jgi:GGDEF domain-containing protein
VARKIRALVADAPFNAQGKPRKLTASFGVCGFDVVSADDPKTPDRILKAAGTALYRSKHSGRNRVTATRGIERNGSTIANLPSRTCDPHKD